ncbi:DUF1543 domain-containing protein [Kerstersia gyiorum]|uniref:DUF1543 domain-containing protein n=1 Tax=Kerstersia gyiorum TaxID=206506 RepID=UPI0030CA6B30
MVKLHMFYVGGNAGRSNIEVHDIQFAAVDRPEAAWPLLRQAWFGDPDKIHVDGYSVIEWADGHDVRLLPAPPAAAQVRLFFVNVGGYRADTLAEQHEYGLFVAPDAATAKRRALERLLPGIGHQHRDNLKDVDDCLMLNELGGWYIHLGVNPDGREAGPAWQGYQPIGVPARTAG